MTLTSLTFFGFVAASLIVYYIVPKKWRYLVLLAASLAFYGIVCFKYFPFIIFTALSTWAGALWLDKVAKDRKALLKEHKAEWDSEQKKKFKHSTIIRRRWILALVLVLNFGILAVLKYYNFLAEWFGNIINMQLPMVGLLLPLGISFYTFQSMGYIIDVYWEKTPAEKNIARFGLFATFFPQIIQGPIAIYSELAGQLYEGHDLSYENIKYGAQLIFWGLFKKMVIADRLAVVFNTLFPVRNSLSNAYSLLLLVVYMVQLYMDFSGGIDIARGVGCMFGINMAENFRRPFFSKSISEFWRRWHISLGKWLKTYLFYPMAVSKAFLRLGTWISKRGKKPSEEIPDDSIWGGFTFAQHLGRVLPGCIGTLITFFIVGMWHGANWRYAGYGLWNGIIILISMILEPVFKWLLRKLRIRVDTAGWRVFQMIRTAILVVLSVVFDIADNLADGISMIGKCFTPVLGPTTHLGTEVSTGIEAADWIVVITGLLIVFAVSLYQEKTGKHIRESLSRQPLWIQWTLGIGCVVVVAILGMYGPGVASGEFVYMQF
ncbi:MAG: MBOAT family protein [Parasporobacterium sp.]|nr:MBOAT family protein [Parasporobacterium sp.]